MKTPTDTELIKNLESQVHKLVKTKTDCYYISQAAYRIAELGAKLKLADAKLSRLENCHVWEPDDNLANLADKLEIIIPAASLRAMAPVDDLLIRLPCPINTPVFVIRNAYCDKREHDKCDEYCDGWEKYCPNNEAGLEIITQPFMPNMVSEFGKTVFLSEAAAITGKALLEKEAVV